MAVWPLLQDDVPPFPDEEAFAIIQEQLGQPLEAVFSSISEQPVAAASLGQVRLLGQLQGPAAAYRQGCLSC